MRLEAMGKKIFSNGPSKARKVFVLAVLAGLAAFHASVNAVVLRAASDTYTWVTMVTDMDEQIQNQEIRARLARILESQETVAGKIREAAGLLRTDSHRPQLFYLLNAWWELVFGVSGSRFLVSFVCFLLLAGGTYFIGARFFSFPVGLLAAALVSFYPGAADYSRSLMLDFPLAAVFAATLAALLFSLYFCSFPFSLLTGFLAGIGILTKGAFLLFFAPVLCFYLWRSLFLNRPRPVMRLSQILNLLALLALALALASLWARGNVSSLATKFSLYAIPSKTALVVSDVHYLAGGSRSTISFAKDFPATFFSLAWLMSPFFFGVFCAAAFLLGVRRRGPSASFLWVALAAPLFLLAVVGFIKPRYFFPLLPLAAVATFAGLETIRTDRRRRLILAAVCLLAMAQFATDIFGVLRDRHMGFYREIREGYDRVAHQFIGRIRQETEADVSVYFVSQTSGKFPDSLNTMRAFLLRNAPAGMILRAGGPRDHDFVVLSFDGRYYLGLARLLEWGRETNRQAEAFEIFRKRHPWQRFPVARLFLDEKAFSSTLRSLDETLFAQGPGVGPMEVYERICVLEALRRGWLTLSQAQARCGGRFSDLDQWHAAYQNGGVRGLQEDLHVSVDDFRDFLTSESFLGSPRCDARCRELVDFFRANDLVLIDRGSCHALGIDFGLFSRRRKP